MDNNEVLFNETEEYKSDEVTIVAYPWRRHFARALDLSIYDLLWSTFTMLVLRWGPSENLFVTLFNIYVTMGIMLFLEPLLLSRWGTTPGKWLFGLVIRNREGKKLTYGCAFERTFNVFRIGMGYNIPIYNIIRGIKCYKICMSLVSLPWDEGLSYKIKDTKAVRAIGYVGITIASMILTFAITLQAQMPIHRGDITAEQYYENCNDIINYNNIYQGVYINEHGKWEEDSRDGIYNINFREQPLLEHEITISNGMVTGVKLEVEITTDEWITGYTNQKYIAFMSFVAAQKEMNFIKLRGNDRLKMLSNDFKDYSFVEADIRVSNKVEYSGYSSISEQYLFPTEGKEQYFHMVFTMEKVESR
jgi:hypothetical protein